MTKQEIHQKIGEITAQAQALQERHTALTNQQHAITGEKLIIEQRLQQLQQQVQQLAAEANTKKPEKKADPKPA